MQGWHYGKGLIYYRPIINYKLYYNKSALCSIAGLALSFVLFHTLSDVWLQRLFD